MDNSKAWLIAFGLMAATPAAALEFNFVTSGLSADEMGALNRAGNRWTSRLDDPVTINIQVNLTDLGSSQVIGNANAYNWIDSYSNFRDLLTADAGNEADDAVVAALPIQNEAMAFVPTGFTLSGLKATKANFKALFDSQVVSAQVDQFNFLDGVINFNSGFAFDYNAGDGIDAGRMDFETVAAHEIGHILGFVSAVDEIDFLLHEGDTSGEITPYLLDLFRFGPNANPSTTAEFTQMARDFRPGVASYFDDLSTEVAFSTGQYNGDGRQASHWQDTGGNQLGIMDPTLAYTQITAISAFDLRAMDLIGYEIAAVPVPSAAWFFGSGLLALAACRRGEG